MTDVQKKILEIYQEIANLCESEEITFYAIGGTCLGAARDKGFIPWDDDIDIAIPVDEWEHFLECVKKLPEYLQIYTNQKAKNILCHHIKIIDSRTTFIENSNFLYPESYSGVFVDIMPMAGVPSNIFSRKIFNFQLRVLFSLNNKRRRPISIYKGNVKGKLLWLILYLPIHLFSYHFFSDIYMKVLKRHPLKRAEYTGYTWSPKSLPKLTFPKSYFEGTVSLPFEDTYMKCPIGYEKYLKQQFKEYMEYPPEEQRISGHEGFVDLEKNYTYYKEHPELLRKHLK